MTAYGLEERKNTLARVKTINAGRAWQGSVLDDTKVPREDGSGRVLPYTVIDFGAPVRLMRDRNLAYSEKDQPHVLFLRVNCIAGDSASAQALAAAMTDLLLGWAPSTGADPYDAKGGYGTMRNATESVPTRFIEGLTFEAATNVNIP